MVVLWNFKYGKAVPYLLLLITFGEDLGSVSKSTLQNQASNKRSYLKQGRFHKECFVLSVCSLIKKAAGTMENGRGEAGTVKSIPAPCWTRKNTRDLSCSN